MKRIHILLEESDYDKLRELSFKTRKPISKIVREWVKGGLTWAEQRRTYPDKVDIPKFVRVRVSLLDPVGNNIYILDNIETHPGQSLTIDIPKSIRYEDS